MNSNKNQSQELVTLLESIMDFKRWGFKQSYIHISYEIFPEIIYDSMWCRVKFSFEQTDYYLAPPHLAVRYGRLHAPNDDFFMTINGEQYWCWHGIDLTLRFLDGMSSKEAADEWNAYQRRAPFVRALFETMVEKKTYPPERGVRIEAAIWEHYGQKLFEIYDVQNPVIWERYYQFVSEFYKIIDSESHFGYPPKDKIY
jgi:hypothetical protein